MRRLRCKWCGGFYHAEEGKDKDFCSEECRVASQRAESLNSRTSSYDSRGRKKKSGEVNAELMRMAKEAFDHNTTYGKYDAKLKVEKERAKKDTAAG